MEHRLLATESTIVATASVGGELRCSCGEWSTDATEIRLADIYWVFRDHVREHS